MKAITKFLATIKYLFFPFLMAQSTGTVVTISFHQQIAVIINLAEPNNRNLATLANTEIAHVQCETETLTGINGSQRGRNANNNSQTIYFKSQAAYSNRLRAITQKTAY